MRSVTHFASGNFENVGWDDKPRATALCDGKSPLFNSITENPNHIECPDCSKKLATAKIKAEHPDLTLLKATTPGYGYRSAYAVLIGGVQYGYVTLDTGKRARWELRMNNHQRPEREEKSTVSSRTYTRPIIASRKSKEQAALDIFDHRELFNTLDEYKAEIAARNERYAANQKRYEAERAAETEELQTARETIAEMIKREGLTNAEIVALNVALKAIDDHPLISRG